MRPEHRRELRGARAPLGLTACVHQKIRDRDQSQWAAEGAHSVAGWGRRGPGWGWAVREGLHGEATGKLRLKGDGAQTQEEEATTVLRRRNPNTRAPGLPHGPAARTSPSNAGVRG